MNPDTTGGTASSDYDFLVREYSNEGRWVSPDPAGLAAVDPSNPQSWNRYAYVTNSPLSYTDPTGMNKCFNPGTKDLYWCSGKGYVSSGISGGWFWIPDSSVTSEWVLGYTDEGSPIYADVLTTQDPGFWIFLGGGGGDGTANSSGMPQQPSKLAQTLDRAKTCAKAYYGFNTLPGAATDVTRVGTLLAAAPLPKSLLSGVGIRTTTLAGGSSFTNILSVLGQGAGTAASGANIFRIAGRMAGPIAIASAVIDVAAIGVCTVIDQ